MSIKRILASSGSLLICRVYAWLRLLCLVVVTLCFTTSPPCRKEEVLTIKSPGHIFGELTVINNKSWPADTRAKEECKVLEVGPDVLTTVIQQRRHTAGKFMSDTKARVQANAIKGEAWRSFFLLAEERPPTM